MTWKQSWKKAEFTGTVRGTVQKPRRTARCAWGPGHHRHVYHHRDPSIFGCDTGASCQGGVRWERRLTAAGGPSVVWGWYPCVPAGARI